MNRLLWLGAAVCALTSVAAPAEALAADGAVEVGEVVVGGRLEETVPQALAQYGSRLEVVDGETVRQGLFTDVGQVLATSLPGLSVIPQAGPFSYNTASLQGSRSNEILYLIDGVRISNRLYNTTPPLDTAPAHMVQRIEQLEGGQGLFFGSQGVAGVVNIVSRDFTDVPAGRFEIGADTNTAITVNGYVSNAVGKHRLVAFASYDAAKGYQVFPDDEYQASGTDRHRGYRMTSLGGKYAYDLSDRLRVSASYTHTEGYAELPRPNLVSDARNWRNEELAWAKLDWDATDSLSLFVKGYWHDWDSHYDETDNTPSGPVVVDDHEFWGFEDYGLNALARLVARPGLELWAGYDLQRYGGRDDVLIIGPQKETTQAVFSQIRITPELLPRTHLAAGFRSNFSSTSQDITVWNASGAFDLTDAIFMTGSLGTGFRLPDAESLFAQDPLNNGEIGNPDLKPERSRNLNLSLGSRRAGWQVELVGFWRETKDLISLEGETPDPDVLTFINLPGKVQAKGFEVVATGAPRDWLSWRASYTHARTRPSDRPEQLINVAEDFARASLDLHDGGGRYGGGAIVNWVGDVYDELPSGIGRVNRGNYAVLDLNAWVSVGKNSRLSAKLENAFGEDYSVLTRRYFTDDGAPYVGHFRGVPRTLHVAYAYSF